jgi:acetylornithine deacetylase/succinyl-diaminopimelate desuccinylase-like protein
MSTPHLTELFQYLRFQSVSTDPASAPQVAACAAWLRDKFTAMGLQAQVHPTDGHPIVVARTERKPGRRTVLIYGHYDVQPPEPLGEWRTPPFEPTLVDGVIFARGATDNKGQTFAHILGVEKALKEKGDLPVNLIFLLEGEEEIGSTHLGAFLKAHREELACDLIVISDTGMVAPGVPALTYGLRGILGLEVRLHGAETDLHSGIYGGTVPNPATLLARMIATLHDAQYRVAIPGFYDQVAELQPWERNQWAALPLDEAAFKAATRSSALLGEAGYTPLERVWGRPTAEVNGIGGGYQGKGGKTIVPRKAFAKLTFRLVPNQTPEVIAEHVKAHLQCVCPPEVRMEIEMEQGGEPFLCDPNGKDGLAARRAVQRVWGVEPALIREGGSIPILHTLRGTLGAEILLLGLALPDSACHAPNENFPVENFEAGIALNEALLEEIARG